ncbi:MAG: hypothetical protein AB1664_14345 [Thermodesulfobacteriota bacterium]
MPLRTGYYLSESELVLSVMLRKDPDRMIITGSALFIEPGSDKVVLEALDRFPEVTFQAKSDSGSELVVNLEAEDHQALDLLCARLAEAIPQIVDITHLYVHFGDEIEEHDNGNKP